MTVSTLLWWAVLAFLALKVAILLGNTRSFPVLSASRGAPLKARVSLLVPARDEEQNLAVTLPTLLSQPATEIIVLDDDSSDATWDVVQRLASQDPRLRGVRGAPLPDGWVGKTWACQQLADIATGDLLVFVDADVRWQPGALAALVGEMELQEAEVFSVFPRQRALSLSERTLLPLIDDVLLAFLPFGLLRLPVPAAAVANGQVMAFRRRAYDQLGGHRAVQSEILEDVRLAQRVRRLGLQLGLALGGELVDVRMYRSYAELVRGFAKSLLPTFNDSRALLVAVGLWHLVAYTLPLLLLPSQPRWGVLLGLAFLERFLVNRKTGRGSIWEVVLMPLAPLLAVPVIVHALRRVQRWKGRSYA